MGPRRFVSFALALFIPAAAWSKDAEPRTPEAEEIGWGGEVDVSGGPLDLSHLGRAPETYVAPESPPFERSPGWGITETEFSLVPAGAARIAFSDELPAKPGAPWPGPRMLRDWDFAEAFTFTPLAPAVNAEGLAFFGSQGGEDTTVFSERVRMDLYLLQVGVTFLHSLEAARSTRTDMDLDLRIPLALGRHHRLALIPGVTFPIDSREKKEGNTSVRFQGIYGFGGGGFGLQAMAGFVEGNRARGLLLLDERVEEPAILYGGLVSLRIVPVLQLRVEATGEFVTDGGPDRLSLLGGPVFFPLGDPRLSIGVLGILEESSTELAFTRPAWGGLLQAGLAFF